MCMNELDETDEAVEFCQCGYAMCLWCWHRICGEAAKEGAAARCPNCRTIYDLDAIHQRSVSRCLPPLVLQQNQPVTYCECTGLHSLDQRQGYFATREHTWYIAGVITALLRTYTAKADLCAVVSRWLCGRAGWLSTSLWLFDTSAVHQAGGGEEAEGVAARKKKVCTAGREEPQGPGGGHLACTSVARGLTLCGVKLCLTVGIL